MPTKADQPSSQPTGSWFRATHLARDEDFLLTKQAAPKQEGYKTLKMRVTLTPAQKAKFQEWTHAFRWVYNYTVDVLSHCFDAKAPFSKVRDFIRTTERLDETITCGNAKLEVTEFVETERNKFPVPAWMDRLKFHNRAYRGAIKNCVENWNSAMRTRGHGRFKLGFRMKTDQSYFSASRTGVGIINPCLLIGET